jgi:hypothetical protein
MADPAAPAHAVNPGPVSLALTGVLAVAGHRPQLGPVDADHVGERVRVALVAFGSGGAIPFLEAVETSVTSAQFSAPFP